jgi:hypothetical protein
MRYEWCEPEGGAGVEVWEFLPDVEYIAHTST